MKIKRVQFPPKDGTQFVDMWIWNDKLWSTTYRYNELGHLESYVDEDDDFTSGFFPRAENIEYFVVK